MNMHIGNCLRVAHTKTGLLYKDIAAAIGWDRSNYSHLLAQKNMQADTFIKACQALGLSLDEVVGFGDEDGAADTE